MIHKQLIYLGAAIITSLSFQSCDQPKQLSQKTDSEMVQPKEVVFDLVKDGYLTGNGEEGIVSGGVVIRSQEEWDALAKKMNSVNKAIEKQSFDFNRVTVIAYFDNIRGSGGYSVDVSSVTETDKKLAVTIKKTASDGNDIEIMTQPYVIGAIAKTDLQVVFMD